MALALCGLCACNEATSKDGIAATVNGVAISEQDITEAIEGFRTSESLSDNDAWAAWLAENELAPEDVRQDALNTYIEVEIVMQGAQEAGIEVDDEEVEASVEKQKANYSSEEEWQAALADAGLTQESHRSNVREELVTEKFKSYLAQNIELPEEDLLNYGSMVASSYDGAKRSSHILFSADDESLAKEILAKIESRDITFEDAAKTYSIDSSSENGGDIGWNAGVVLDENYANALDELAVGEVSGLVTSDYGIHIITCTDYYEAPESITSIDQIPDEFVQLVEAMLTSSYAADAYNNWLQEAREKADIVTYAMPSDVPYNIDPSSADANKSEASKTTTAGADADSTSEDSTESEPDSILPEASSKESQQ